MVGKRSGKTKQNLFYDYFAVYVYPPIVFLSNTRIFLKKKSFFTTIKRLHLITPQQRINN